MRLTRTVVKLYFLRSPTGRQSAEALLEALLPHYPGVHLGGKDRWKVTFTHGKGALPLEKLFERVSELGVKLQDLRDVSLTYRVLQE